MVQHLPQCPIEERRQEDAHTARNHQQLVEHKEGQNLVRARDVAEPARIADGVRRIDDGAADPRQRVQQGHERNVRVERTADFFVRRQAHEALHHVLLAAHHAQLNEGLPEHRGHGVDARGQRADVQELEAPCAEERMVELSVCLYV